MRTRNNGELRIHNVGEEVTLVGWCAKKRDLGGLVFIDLRDRWGITQVIVEPTNEYYKVTEGIKMIDDKAFFVVTDSYEVVGAK